jgi:hypothetical protein
VGKVVGVFVRFSCAFKLWFVALHDGVTHGAFYLTLKIPYGDKGYRQNQHPYQCLAKSVVEIRIRLFAKCNHPNQVVAFDYTVAPFHGWQRERASRMDD